MNSLELLLPDFCIILLGHALANHSPLDHRIWSPVENLVYYLLFPILLFTSIIQSPLDWHTSGPLIEAGLILCACAISLSYALVHLPLLKSKIDAHKHAASAQVAFRFNSFIALALVQRLYAQEGLLKISILIGICVPILNVAAVWPMAKAAQRGFFKELIKNPLVIATTLGLSFNLTGLQCPQVALLSLQKIGAASIPLGLMAAGASLHLSRLKEELPLGLSLLTIRHLLLPIAAFFLAPALSLAPMEGSLLLVFSALPTASTCFVLASRMGFDGTHVAGLVTMSTLLGFFSLSFAYSLTQLLY